VLLGNILTKAVDLLYFNKVLENNNKQGEYEQVLLVD